MQSNNREADKLKRIACAYLTAKEYVIKSGYGPEIDQQEDIFLSNVSERYFLRESAWVILCSGMREAIIRRLFIPISEVFFQWNSAEEIIDCANKCRNDALKLFRHQQKIDSILKICDFVANMGITYIKDRVNQEGHHFLQQLPFIGPVTSKHLAKNLGVQIAKPDRHLLRIATALNYLSVDNLCEDIAKITQHPVSVIDLVLWRYATLNQDYATLFSEAN